MQIIIIEVINVIIILSLFVLFRLGIINYRKSVKKQISYYKLLLNWDLSDVHNEKLCAYMLECGYKNIMIYGAGDLGKVLYSKIATHVNVCAFIEKAPKADYIENVPIFSCNKATKQMNQIDCIVVTPIFDFLSIQQDLSNIDGNIPIVSLDELIYNL